MIKLNEHNIAHKPQQTENAAQRFGGNNTLSKWKWNWTNERLENMTSKKDMRVIVGK